MARAPGGVYIAIRPSRHLEPEVMMGGRQTLLLIRRAFDRARAPGSVRAILCLALALGVVAQPARSQEQGRMKALRVEAGYSANHEGDDVGLGGGLRFVVSRRGNDALRFETGLIAGIPYLGVDLGVEVRVPSETAVGVVLRAGGGLLVEDGFTGPYFRGGGGLEWLLNRRVALRATGQAGYHGGQHGPHLLQLGIDYRW